LVKGKLPVTTRTVYGASKAALNHFFASLRAEEPSISITTVNPGFVISEIHHKAYSPEGTAPERKLSNFMRAEKCAELIVDAGSRKKREVIMTLR
jgi:short-subunit dehydrogenase